MSEVSARKLVRRLKDDEAFRKAVGCMEFAEAWQMVQNQGYQCSAEEIQKAYDSFGCGIIGPRSAWREAVKKLCRLPLRYPGSHVNRGI
jgi:hypothetical protein